MVIANFTSLFPAESWRVLKEERKKESIAAHSGVEFLISAREIDKSV